MSDYPEKVWRGSSGEEYHYTVYDLESSFPVEPGNYIFASYDVVKGWIAVYIGQTHNLQERLTNHEKENCTAGNDATHIHIHINHFGEQARLDEERELIENYDPCCNNS